ncbi:MULTISPECIES: hypothetical protein [Micrococcaceae]|uniref:hypothetical protein n=1 Tax=unclassified Kocuria TaxID=2649579 RepID=UPI0010133FC5|nr:MULTISPECIES: hypothetical protein [unclassified Kocuria]
MLNSAILASATVAEESAGYDLGIPHWLVAVIFFCLFLLMLLVVVSFSGRGVRRDGLSNPAEISPDEQDAMTEYNEKHHR